MGQAMRQSVALAVAGDETKNSLDEPSKLGHGYRSTYFIGIKNACERCF
jgi:hypothetical protein